MSVYFIYYFFLLGIGFLFYILGILKSKRGKILFLSLVWLTLTIISGLRSYDVAYDGHAYEASFETFSRMPWQLPWHYSHFMEYGFYIFCKIISMLGGTCRTMYFLSSAFVTFSVCYFLYKHSEGLLFSTVILLSYPYFYTSFDIIRYYLAISIVLLAYDFVIKRKFLSYVVCVIIAMQFHKTIIIMLLLYMIPEIRWNTISITITAIITLIITFFLTDIARIFAKIFNDYESYISGSNTWWIGSFAGGIKTAIMYGVLLIIAIFAYKNKEKKDKDYNQCIGYMVLVFSVAFMFINSSMALRLLVALLPFMSISLTKLLDYYYCYDEKTQFLLRYITVLICVAYHTYLIYSNWQNIVPYKIYLME